MNEHLRELAVKAQVEHCISHVRLKEFAELIIKECVSKIEDAAEDSPELYGVALDLMEHFGIEE